MKYEIDFGFGTAILYTENNDWEKRFYELADTCFGIRKSIAYASLIHSSEEVAPNRYEDECERLEFNGDMYIWRKDGARRMIKPFEEKEWNVDFINDSSKEKKCETCAFCTQKPENLSFLPNEWICGCFSCKWFNYWPPTGVCENYAEPTGKTVAEVLGERGKQAYDGVRTLLNAMWGNNSSDEYVEKFMQEDSAVLEMFGWLKKQI